MPGIKVAISPAFNKLIPSGTPYIFAEGGLKYRDPLDLNYVIHKLTESSDFVVTSNLGGYELEFLLVPGGGQGGDTNNGGAAGGSGGEPKQGTFAPTVRSYAYVHGKGGNSPDSYLSADGENATFETESGTVIAEGGKGGGNGQGSNTDGNGRPGKLGSGMGYNRPVFTAVGTLFNGGAYTSGDDGAGGAGMTEKGGDALSGTVTGQSKGGDGFPSTISGTLKYYGAGGAGGVFLKTTGYKGGNNGVGGNGGFGTTVYTPPTNPEPNSGSGGGGAGNDGNVTLKQGSDGADGVLYVRYLSPLPVDSFDYEIILENNDF